MIVMTLGTFDLFHTGHVELLRRCKQLSGGSDVVVGLNTDGFVERYKGRPPVIGYADREAVLRACRFVDRVVPNDQPGGSAADAVLGARARVIAVGSDWQGRDYLGQLGVSAEWLEARGVSVVYLARTPGISSSQIREALR